MEKSLYHSLCKFSSRGVGCFNNRGSVFRDMMYGVVCIVVALYTYRVKIVAFTIKPLPDRMRK